MSAVLSACAPEEDGDDGAASVSSAGASQQEAADADEANEPMPPIHVDLLEEPLMAGRNVRRDAYEQALQHCQDAGFPTTPLSPQQAERLGTAHVQLFFSDEVQVLSRQSWNYLMKGVESQRCTFQLVSAGLHSRIGPDATIETDLETGETTRGPTDADRLQRISEHVDSDQVMETLGYSGPVKMTVAGQPCARWTAPDGATVCLWSGGRQWGFSDEIDARGCSPAPLSTYESAIVLAQTAPTEGMGCKVTVRRFTVGTSFEAADLEPPGEALEASP
ncbi:hypothetical protein [Lysobacter sp. F60174L2]|uniref:hypothetical protein n=1 Tax=Lysobacter sp. F60174L2 TaxID=3459295 RepID=UPI00403DB269